MNKAPKCPTCNKDCNPSGGVVGTNITTHWSCWNCNEQITDVEDISEQFKDDELLGKHLVINN